MENLKTGTKKRNRLIQRASLSGIIGNAILSVLKISVGIISGSAAVIADGIDSASDIIASIITYYANTVSAKAPDKKHPWGYQRIETIAAKVIAILIVFAGLQLVIATVGRFFDNESNELPRAMAIVVTLISILGKAGISAYQHYIGKKTNSSMVLADSVHMRNDIYLSGAVLLGLGATFLTNLPIFDTLIGTALGIWIIWTGIKLSLESNTELMDSFEDQETLYKKLFDVIEKVPEASNPHRVRIRKINNQLDISMDIEVDSSYSIVQAHEISKLLEEAIRMRFDSVFDIMIHVEPKGNVENEQFGLSIKDV